MNQTQLFSIDTITTLLIVTFIANTVYGLIVFLRNRSNKINKYFFFLTIAIDAWIGGMIAYRALTDLHATLVACRWLYAGAASVPSMFLYFALHFTHDDTYKIPRKTKWLIISSYLIVAAISLYPGALIKDVQFAPVGEKIVVFDYFLHALYGMHIIGFIGAAHVYLYRSYRQAHGDKKIQLRNIFIGTLIAGTLGMICNLVLPYFGIFTINWLGNIGIMGMVIPIFYSIVRYNLFNIKIIIAEALVFILWFILLTRTFFSIKNGNPLLDGLVFTLSIVIGFILIRSVRREVESRARIQHLDELKTEFVALARHHISNPLTAIKGYASLIQEGNYPHLPGEVSQNLNAISRISNNLVAIVQDFLDITKIEQREVEYHFSSCDLKTILENILDEQAATAKKKNINISFVNKDEYKPDSDIDEYPITADQEKLEQALSNIITNSLKYTTNGTITISLTRQLPEASSFNPNHDAYLVTISDTGTRSLPAATPKLLEKFTNSGDKTEASIISNGLGLYVAKQYIEAHRGYFRIVSNSTTPGATFTIELPAKA